ncbi:MAG: tyrosine-type recombinase/integrase [Planctomycetota bacterium]
MRFSFLALLENRINVSELQVLLGHSKLATTQRYLHTAELLDDATLILA